jgi:integral membrane protein
MDSDKKTLTIFLKIGLAEGISFLILLGIAMPLKYIGHMPTPVRIVGMLHGVLFVAYSLLLFKATIEYKWGFKKAGIGFLLSFLPFGTFYLDRILKKGN